MSLDGRGRFDMLNVLHAAAHQIDEHVLEGGLALGVSSPIPRNCISAKMAPSTCSSVSVSSRIVRPSPSRWVTFWNTRAGQIRELSSVRMVVSRVKIVIVGAPASAARAAYEDAPRVDDRTRSHSSSASIM